ncbi:NAD-dependent epimerase/dehydratase family protein [Chitinimonas sp. BJYL2]|uniref:NAD-dependent epimerase/dehydratase family protein n=1 Tax=Chitinimonas sp. BJYL2 TaxID=2976696 RepID=UPI0022B55EBE|nr:NAD-dependent epimerase/dehydratase family protein [Chitinimonas sp. BJYL2]
MSNYSVLVTGGAGFIGSHTVERLLARGLRVRVLDNLSTGKRSNLAGFDGVELLEGDIRDPAVVAQAMAGVSHVLHLAAQVSVQASIENPPASADHNLRGFLTVLDAARRAGAQRVVYASSAAVYGQPAELPLTESSAVQPVSPYGLEKLVNDQYASLYRDLYQLSSLGLRYFNVYGPRQDPASPYAGVLSKFKERIATQQTLTVFGDGEQTRDFIYVGDVAEANVRALLAQGDGILNIATGESVTLNQVIHTLGKVVGRALQVDYQPARTGDIIHSAAKPDALHRVLGHLPMTPLAQGLTHLLAAEA